MTVNEAIARSEALGIEGTSREEQIRWLGDIEKVIWQEIIETHHSQPEAWIDISSEDGNRDLLAEAPYDVLYLYYLAMQNDLRLRDTTRYSQSAALFTSAYASFADWYNRTHMPTGTEKIRL